MNSILSKMLSAMNEMMGVKDGGKNQTKKLGHEPTPQKKVRKRNSKPTNRQRTLMERKEKKRRKVAAKQRAINRLRGVGI